jgi:hypothetical protein
MAALRSVAMYGVFNSGDCAPTAHLKLEWLSGEANAHDPQLPMP